MRSLITQLHRTKLVLSCLVFAVVGAAMIATGRWAAGSDGWISWIPWSEFGGVLIGAGVLSIGLDHYLRREQEAIDDVRLRQLFVEQAPAMRDAVLQAFAADQEDLERIATPEMLDQVITNSLALRLRDDQFASEVYADIRDQAITAAERWHDASLSIKLSPVPRTPGSSAKSGGNRYFAATVRWEYTTTPAHAQRQFICLADREEYAELLHEKDSASAWYIKPDGGIDATSPESFELLRLAINGEEKAIRRSTRKGAQIYTASIGTNHVAEAVPVTVTYTYRALMAQSGHLLFFDIEQPTRDLQVTFDYTDCGIASVSTLDMVPSVRPTRIEVSPASSSESITRVHVDGWIFPRSGVAFVWTLDSE